MNPVVTDIDIDVPDRDSVLSLFSHTVASNGDRKHNTGVYFHKIPQDPSSGRATINYREAEEMGYFKIDLLNVSIYKDVRDTEHMNMLLEREPVWELLEEEEFCEMLFHMRGHYDICKKMKPRTVLELAAVLAMIRPAKRHLIGKPWDQVMKMVWVPPKDDEYYFKKAHSLSYALAVVLHMNILVEKLESNSL